MDKLMTDQEIRAAIEESKKYSSLPFPTITEPLLNLAKSYLEAKAEMPKEEEDRATCAGDSPTFHLNLGDVFLVGGAREGMIYNKTLKLATLAHFRIVEKLKAQSHVLSREEILEVIAKTIPYTPRTWSFEELADAFLSTHIALKPLITIHDCICPDEPCPYHSKCIGNPCAPGINLCDNPEHKIGLYASKPKKIEQGLQIACDRCRELLTEQGALIFSPPENGVCKKMHICKKCYNKEE